MNSQLKHITALLSQKKNSFLITDAEYKILWSSCPEIADELLINLQKEFSELYPPLTEISVSATIGGEETPVIITPFKTTKDTIYIMEVFDSIYLATLVGEASFWNKIKMSLFTIYSGLSNVINSTVHLKSNLNKSNTELHATTERQYKKIVESLTEINRLTTIFQEPGIGNQSVNIKDTLDLIIKELLCKLNSSTRIEFDSEGGVSAVAMSENQFTFSILELLENALYYSPKDTKVSVKLYFRNNTAHIDISNFLLPENLLPYKDNETKLGITKAKISFGQAGGDMTFRKSGDIAVAKITLPLVNPGRKKLNSKLKNIHSLSPVNLFFEKIKLSEDEKN